MPRRIFYQRMPGAEGQLTIDEFVSPREEKPKPKRVLRGISDTMYTRAVRELPRLMQPPHEGFRGVHAVILFERHYRTTYNQSLVDFESSRNRKHAAIAADRMLKTLFGGKVNVFFKYFEYAWRREKAREKLRREQGKTGTKLNWRRFFSKKYDFDDWRTDYVRVEGHAPDIVVCDRTSPVDELDDLM